MRSLLSRDSVALGLTYIATSLSRKIDQARIDIYHRELGRTLDDEQFAAAVAVVLDEDDKFPSIARLKAAGRSKWKREQGEPTVTDYRRREIATLRECLAAIDAGQSPGGDDQYRGRTYTKPHIERLVWEDAAVTVEPVAGEGLASRLRRIADTATAKLDQMEASAIPIAVTRPQQETLDVTETAQESPDPDSTPQTGA